MNGGFDSVIGVSEIAPYIYSQTEQYMFLKYIFSKKYRIILMDDNLYRYRYI